MIKKLQKNCGCFHQRSKKIRGFFVKKQHTLGFISCYRYQLVTTGDNTRMYIFVNCERELNTFHTFLLASIGFWWFCFPACW